MVGFGVLRGVVFSDGMIGSVVRNWLAVVLSVKPVSGSSRMNMADRRNRKSQQKRWKRPKLDRFHCLPFPEPAAEGQGRHKSTYASLFRLHSSNFQPIAYLRP